MDVSRRAMMGMAGAAVAAGAVQTPPARAKAPFAPAVGIAQLSRNENPYGPSPAALAAMAEAGPAGCYYANGGEQRLAAMIAERNGLAPDQVLLGSGSTEVLNCATMALGREGTILAPELLFDPPLRYAEAKGVAVRRVALRPDMHMDLSALLAALGPDVRLVHLCNPNNPTGLVLSGDTIRRFIAEVRVRAPGALILVDEAYVELTDDPARTSVVDRVRAGDPVIVTRTFSKLHGLAGLRVGYAMARPDLVAAMGPWLMSIGGNAAGLAAAMASLDDRPFLAMSKARIVEARAMLAAAARAQGLETLPSAANFVLVKVPDAEALRARLEGDGIVIRGPYGRFREWSRVSCGRIEDVRRYTAALPRALAA